MLEKLDHIKECPHCTCKKVKERSQSHKHTNGHWNEYLTFDCGYQVHFSPNFMQIVEKGECERSQEFKEMISGRKLFIDKLRKYISKADVDEEFKRRITSNIAHL